LTKVQFFCSHDLYITVVHNTFNIWFMLHRNVLCIFWGGYFLEPRLSLPLRAIAIASDDSRPGPGIWGKERFDCLLPMSTGAASERRRQEIYHPNLNWSRVKLGGRQFRYSLNIRRRRLAFDFSYRSNTASERQMMCCPL
jgi:hypothetical protein